MLEIKQDVEPLLGFSCQLMAGRHVRDGLPDSATKRLGRLLEGRQFQCVSAFALGVEQGGNKFDKPDLFQLEEINRAVRVFGRMVVEILGLRGLFLQRLWPNPCQQTGAYPQKDEQKDTGKRVENEVYRRDLTTVIRRDPFGERPNQRNTLKDLHIE